MFFNIVVFGVIFLVFYFSQISHTFNIVFSSVVTGLVTRHVAIALIQEGSLLDFRVFQSVAQIAFRFLLRQRDQFIQIVMFKRLCFIINLCVIFSNKIVVFLVVPLGVGLPLDHFLWHCEFEYDRLFLKTELDEPDGFAVDFLAENEYIFRDVPVGNRFFHGFLENHVAISAPDLQQERFVLVVGANLLVNDAQKNRTEVGVFFVLTASHYLIELVQRDFILHFAHEIFSGFALVFSNCIFIMFFLNSVLAHYLGRLAPKCPLVFLELLPFG